MKKRPGNKLDVNKAQLTQILDGTILGKTPTEIAASTELTTQTVHSVQDQLKPLFDLALNAGKFKAQKNDIIEASLGMALTFLIDPAAWKCASLRDRAYATEVIHKITRLEGGKSTSNIAAFFAGPALDDPKPDNH